jgi:hypothetical protein
MFHVHEAVATELKITVSAVLKLGNAMRAWWVTRNTWAPPRRRVPSGLLAIQPARAQAGGRIRRREDS